MNKTKLINEFLVVKVFIIVTSIDMFLMRGGNKTFQIKYKSISTKL